MKIVSSRKDDILKRKAEYEAKLAEYEAAEDADESRYREAELAVTKPIQDMLEQQLSHYSALHFIVRVSKGWSRNGGGVEVSIECNENEKFNDDNALSWSYNAKLNSDGEVVRETSSWSGLKATSADQMKSLRQTVSALEYLNGLDWEKIVRVDMPKYSDYIDRNRKRPEREDFEGQLKAAELEELVGANKAILVKSWGESCPYNGYCYVKLIKETPAQYSAEIAPAGYRGDYTEEQVRAEFARGAYDARVRKTSINPVSPIKVVDLD